MRTPDVVVVVVVVVIFHTARDSVTVVTVRRKVESPRQQSLEKHNIILYHLVITNTYCSIYMDGGRTDGLRGGRGSRYFLTIFYFALPFYILSLLIPERRQYNNVTLLNAVFIKTTIYIYTREKRLYITTFLFVRLSIRT